MAKLRGRLVMLVMLVTSQVVATYDRLVASTSLLHPQRRHSTTAHSPHSNNTAPSADMIRGRPSTC